MYGGSGYQHGGRGPRGPPMGYRGRGQNDSRFHPYSRGHTRPPRGDFGGYQRGPPPSHHFENRPQFDRHQQYPPNPVSARFFAKFFFSLSFN